MQYSAPCIHEVCPVPIISEVPPASLNARIIRQAVVRLPTAESVPSTATLRAVTCSIFPLKK